MFIYGVRKSLVSFEFIVLLLIIFDFQLVFFEELNTRIINGMSFWPGIAPAVAFLLYWKIYFPEKDKDNVIRDFPEKNRLYITNIVGISYYFLFYFIFCSTFFYDSLIEVGGARYFPVLSLVGIIICLLQATIAGFMINIIIRDN